MFYVKNKKKMRIDNIQIIYSHYFILILSRNYPFLKKD